MDRLVKAATLPHLGARVIDRATGIEGTLVATTRWLDRSDEGAILRPGVDADGHPWPVHWVPAARIVAELEGASS
ncbi:hypothetical protein QQS45_00135 [Alteriqipengyuania flavescens]|uniref:hypothetical protein n=1 Tax=Alteriqipengyuania flavescens TaxID=3053610 RepID=UPI0025B3FED4|nr:hypothetical protein [Alteriqipengyuania flavescens]WJY18698.1 hypothetical protein QQW98_00135 [Alteriqipengyuania flavescens]WJY24638.1 hypothetical protein QQS45_00135 [Alteriqipengyuania flavescens]